MTRREELLRDIDLHRRAVSKHEAGKKYWAADAARKCLQIAQLNLKQLDEAGCVE